MALSEEQVDGNITILKNGCVLIERISRVLKAGIAISENKRLDIIAPGDAISGESQAVQSLIQAARNRGGEGDYKAMIRRRAKKLKERGRFYEALLLLKKIGE